MYKLRSFVRGILLEYNQKTTHWGIGGAGIIFVCPEDRTVFLQKRGRGTHSGAGQWAFPGGGIHPSGEYEHLWSLPLAEKWVLPDNSPRFYQTAVTEVDEECGSVPKHRVVDTYLYEDRGFKYRTFIAAVSLQAKRDWISVPDEEHAWEVADDGWFTYDEFTSANLFFGFTPKLIAKTLRWLK